MPKVELWIVTISSEHSINEIAPRLRDEGLTIRDLMEEIGCITGEADNDAVERIRCLEGVIDIAPDTPMGIGPPGANETW
ncbi:hypothetical protein [Vreelandella sulfidaeris]|uniref:hypothetical protein n=1 Tax=Vreelandella sulfidaeris TaxID=115553 RepID=UPI0035E7B6B8|tara:strand:- start:855 stop:1094 length:240 start_codon:yes stop_codon:yes gene_type:complete